MTTEFDPDALWKAAEAIAWSDALLVTAGAGMGVDSGLPDFRGDVGFWRAYPPLKALGISFVDMANPRWFDTDPELAWGFYGHRLNLYRQTVPHPGFQLLRKWEGEQELGGFVVTSNVDGQFQHAGFAADRVLECHGSIHHLQCVRECGSGIWSAASVELQVDDRFRAVGPLPRCAACDALARPNVLMFGDGHWAPGRTDVQERAFQNWVNEAERICVIELGAGLAVPTIRRLSESLARRGARLIRVNPRDTGVPGGSIALIGGADAALAAIEVVRR